MSRLSIYAAPFLAAAFLAGAPLPTPAQNVDTSQPVSIKESKPKPVTFYGEVLHANVQAITVRSRDNQLLIRTFVYAPEIRDRMQQIAVESGYQFGDKVEIEAE